LWPSTIFDVTGLTPYILFDGQAREALTFYANVFGGATQLHTFGEFSRDDGPAEAIAHGLLFNSPVVLYGADVGEGDVPFRAQGLMLSLLGTADAATLRRWFASLSQGGEVVEELQQRPWGAFDGQVIDRFGLRWLIGFEHDENL
jgi:PhnB protein